MDAELWKTFLQSALPAISANVVTAISVIINFYQVKLAKDEQVMNLYVSKQIDAYHNLIDAVTHYNYDDLERSSEILNSRGLKAMMVSKPDIANTISHFLCVHQEYVEQMQLGKSELKSLEKEWKTMKNVLMAYLREEIFRYDDKQRRYEKRLRQIRLSKQAKRFIRTIFTGRDTTMFYKLLEKLCEGNGTSVTAVVKELGLSSSKVTAWKNGSCPKADILLKIADYFGVSMNYLMTGNESAPSELEKSYERLNDIGKQKVKSYIQDLLMNSSNTITKADSGEQDYFFEGRAVASGLTANKSRITPDKEKAAKDVLRQLEEDEDIKQ